METWQQWGIGLGGMTMAFMGYWLHHQRQRLQTLIATLSQRELEGQKHADQEAACRRDLARESQLRQESASRFDTLSRTHRQREEFLAATASALSGIVLAVTPQGRVVHLFGDSATVVGLPSGTLLGTGLPQWLAPQDRESCQTVLTTLQNGHRPEPLWTTFDNRQGQQHPICLIGHPLPAPPPGDPATLFCLVLFNPKAHSTPVQGHCRLHQLLLSGRGDKPGWMETSQKIDSVLVAQVDGAIQDTAAAAQQIFAESMLVSEDMEGLSRFLADSRDRSMMLGSNSRQMIEQDQASIQTFKGYIAGQEESRRQEELTVREAIREVQALANLTDKVLNLSDRTKVLAINAGIVAARAGMHGKQFSVVAHEVRAMAEQTAQVAREIEQGIDQSAKKVETALMQRINSAAAREQESLLAGAASQMDRLGHHFSELLTFTTATMTKITESSESVARKIMELVTHLQFQDIVRQRLEQVTATVKRRSDFQEEMIRCASDPDSDLDHLYFDVDHMMKDYVMAKQRTAHRAITHGHQAVDDHADEGSIILF